jgi:hypothetical protein
LISGIATWLARTGWLHRPDPCPRQGGLQVHCKPATPRHKRHHQLPSASKDIELKSITIGKKSYAVKADAVTIPENQREVVITLREPLKIAR